MNNKTIENDTPETDSELAMHNSGEEFVNVNFARRLERQRDEWKRKCLESNNQVIRNGAPPVIGNLL